MILSSILSLLIGLHDVSALPSSPIKVPEQKESKRIGKSKRRRSRFEIRGY